MSWLSRILGLDKKPAELNAVNAIGNTVLSGIEAASPIAAALVNVLEQVGNIKITTPASAISQVGNVVLVLDPSLFTNVETALNNVLVKAGVPAAVIDELDITLIDELKALGVSVPT